MAKSPKTRSPKPTKPTKKAPPAKAAAAKSPGKTVRLVVPVAGAVGASAAATPDAAQAYALYLPTAQAIPMAKVVPFRFDPAIALANVQAILAALAPYRAQLAALPLPFDIRALDQLSGIALGLVYAAAQVDLSSPGTIAALRKAVAASRTLLLKAAIALVASGLLPAAVLQRIQRGKGTRDDAQDCIDLAQVFTRYASAIAGKSAITQADIDTASSVGNQLLAALRPAGAPSVPRNVTHPAVAIRDQFGTLLQTTYLQALRAAMWIWVDAVYDHVPALHSRAVSKKKAAAAPAPATPAAPTHPTTPTIT